MPKETAEPKPKLAKFWLESTVFPKGHPQYRTLDPFEGAIARGVYPNIQFKGHPLVIHGLVEIDDPAVCKSLLKAGGNLRYDPQQIVDCGLIPFNEIVDIIGAEPTFWSEDRIGEVKSAPKKIYNSQKGEVPPVTEDPEIPLKRVTRMTLEEIRFTADCFGVFIPERTGQKKAGKMFTSAFEKMTTQEKKEGMKKLASAKKGFQG